MQIQKVLHYPRLDTILMVEEAIRKAEYYPSKRQLWLSLHKKMMYQTLNVIIDYLERSNKVIIKDRKIIWVWYPEGVARLRKYGRPWRKTT